MEGEEEEYWKRTAIKNLSGISPRARSLSKVDENKCPEFKILKRFELERNKTEYKTNEDLKKNMLQPMFKFSSRTQLKSKLKCARNRFVKYPKWWSFEIQDFGRSTKMLKEW